MFVYHFLDFFFVVFHTFLVLFNLLGWIHPKTRKWNLVTLALTAVSWFGFGIFYGIGYCILTDWHWQILQKLGETNVPDSYIQYLLERLLGLHTNARIVDICTMAGFILSVIISVFLNVNDYKRKKKRLSM